MLNGNCFAIVASDTAVASSGVRLIATVSSSGRIQILGDGFGHGCDSATVIIDQL